MKQSTNRTLSRYWFIQAASKHLLALALSVFALPGLLSAQTLVHRYSFATDASDSVGTATGTVVAPNGGSPVTFNNGLILAGGGGNDFSGYVSLPSGILANTTNLTIECWLTQSQANEWAEPWDFALNTSQNFGLILDPGNNNGNMEVAFTPSGGEIDLQSSIPFPSGTEQYVALTYNAASLVGDLYTNGAEVATKTFPSGTYTPSTFGGGTGPTVNALGNDIYGDSQFQGTIYEFRIWSGAVSQRYVAASAIEGPNVVVTGAELTPTAISMTLNATNTVVSGILQPTIMVQIALTGSAELPATQDATNWTSSNPNVVTVSSSGVITGAGVGTATVSAKVGGVSVTSPVITVVPQTLLHRYSFATDASDSIGGANGAIVAPTGTGTAVSIANGLVMPGGGVNDNGYVALPPGILTNTTSLTVECWVEQNTATPWATVWDFGVGGGNNFEMCPNPQRGINNLDVAVNPPQGEIDAITGSLFPDGSQQYVAFNFNASTLSGAVFTNGVLAATQTYPNATYIPGTIGGAAGTPNDWLGNDVFSDQQFSGTLYELRIWNGAVSPVYLAASAVAGPGVMITNTTPQGALTVSVATSMVGSQTQQATVTGNFIQATNATLTDAVNNWASSNPNILTVNSSGLITGVSGGTATVTATVNGVSGASAVITVQATAPTIPQKPANTTGAVNGSAAFSVSALGGGLDYQWSFDGTPITGATNNTLTLANLALIDAGTYSVLISNTIGSTNLSANLAVVPAILLHRYSFATDASDSVGGANGAIVGPNGGSAVTIANGLTLPAGGGGGYSGYVSLPAGILTNTASITVECWVTQAAPSTWGTVWDFGNNGNQNFELCPTPAAGRNNGNMIGAFTPNGGEVDLDTPTLFPNGTEEYVSETFNISTLVADLYTNGVIDGTVTLPNTGYAPANIGGAGGTTENWLGNDVYGDPQFQGTIYELRIWNGAVTPLYLALSAIAGPGVVVTNFTPELVDVTVTNATMTAGTTQPASAVGNFVNGTGVVITDAITNWSSSDTSVLTVNSSGLITAVNTGSATISGTVGGVTGTSASITVPTSAPMITQQPEGSESLLAGATLNASVAAIGNPPFVYSWYNGTTLVSTATNSSTLAVSDLPAGSYTYTVVISNAYGNATSAPINLTVVAPTPYQQVVQKLDPVGYWPLGETSGTTAYDVIGGHNGAFSNNVTLQVTGPANTFFGATSYAAGFDGSSAYVNIPEGPFNLTNAITSVAWVQLGGLNGFDGLFGHGDASWRMSVNGSGQPGGNDGTSASGDATSATSINDGNWHMVAYTYTGAPGKANNGSFYVDGTLVANNTVLTTPVGNDLDVWIGGAPDYGTARLVYANIAHAAIFSQALTTAQVQGLYNGVYVAPPNTTISIARSGSSIVLTWQTGTLLSAPGVNGPWTAVSAATSPYTVPVGAGNQFYRVQVSP